MTMEPKQGRRFDPILIGTVLLAAFLNIFNTWQQPYANVYYTSAVTSMLQSFHNFFYASLDPGGYVTVDKPPVTFWVQTAFAYVFGVRGWSVILPQALAGVGSVLLVYVLVKPTFGRTAARLASLVMACTPVAVAVSRTNNIDSLLVFTLLLAAWMLLRGIRNRKVLWVLGAFAMIGVGFNMKMLQAYLVAPAFYLFYLLAFKGEWKKKLAILGAATVVLVGVSLSWAVAVDLVPEEDRPYIGGSQTNSVLELAFGYNGIARLKGMGRGDGEPGGAPAGRQPQQDQGTRSGEGQGQQDEGPGPGRQQGNPSDQRQMRQDGADNRPDPEQAPQAGNNTSAPPQAPMPSYDNGSSGGFAAGSDGRQGQMPGPGGGGPQGGRGGGMFGTGNAGPLRLFQSELSGQISWLLPFAAFGCLGLLAGLRRRTPLTGKQKETLFWLAWLLPSMAFFSVAGFFHHYYLIMLAPPIAALTGAGWVALRHLYGEQTVWKRWLLPAAILAAVAFQLYMLQPYQNQIGMGWSIGIGAAGAGLALVLCLAAGKQRLVSLAAGAGMVLLLAAPLYWSATPLLYGDNSQLPQAGPGGFGQRQGGGGGSLSGINTKLLAYLSRNHTGETYLFATSDTSIAEAYIIQTGSAVMPMGGFNGSDNILTIEKLEQMVADKKVKYFLIAAGGSGGGFGDRGGSGDVLSWIRANGAEVPEEEWQEQSDAVQGGPQSGPGRMGNAQTLYKIEG